MSISQSLKEDFLNIDVHHALFRKMYDEIELLRILLRYEKGQWTDVQDKWNAMNILRKYPDLKYHLEKSSRPPFVDLGLGGKD